MLRPSSVSVLRIRRQSLLDFSDSVLLQKIYEVAPNACACVLDEVRFYLSYSALKGGGEAVRRGGFVEYVLIKKIEAHALHVHRDTRATPIFQLGRWFKIL